MSLSFGKFRPGATMQYAAEDCKQKRARPDNRKESEEDLINQLPDGIPVAILSKLPIDEAARTSILSSKWRNLWTFFSGTLEFDGSPTMKEMKRDLNVTTGRNLRKAIAIMFDAERQRYISWMNELVNSLKSSTMEGLKIWFDVGTEFDADKWVQYAIQRKVEKLELYFGYSNEYVLPLKLLRLTSFDSLRVLRLKFITVTEEMLQFLLSCCPFLETLSLVSSGVPESIKISGPSLKLQRLELLRCWKLKYLKISAKNLVSFKYYGSYLDTEFESVPRLVEASFGGAYVDFIGESFFLQLKVLKLDIAQSAPKVMYRLGQLPKLKHLKRLELVAWVDDGIAINSCVLLLKASPSLCQFTFKMLNAKPIFCAERKLAMEYHYSLKELELVGFCGAACEVEFVMDVIENAIKLRKITIDPSLPSDLKLQPLGHPVIWDHELNRKRAWEMREKIPPHIEFACL